MPPTLLITGATGHVGLATIQSLPDLSLVRAATSNPERAANILPPRVERIAFDFTNPQTYDAALHGIERVLLVRPPQITDIAQTIAPFIDAAANNGVQQIVFLSVMGAESIRFIPHAKIETHLQASGVSWTFLRPGFFNQNLSTTHAKDIREHNKIVVPAGQGRTSFIDVRDIGAVAAKALTEADHSGQAYTLTGNEALTYSDVATILSEELNRDITYTNPNPLRFIWKEWREGTPLQFAVTMAGIYLPTYLNKTGGLTDTTEKLLGRPPITFRQFVRDYRKAWC